VKVAVGAVDFGASSIRVCRITFAGGPPEVEVVHRHAHAPVHDGGHLRWDWDRLVAEMERGLEAARACGPLASIGVDTWGVDYGLLDHRGELVEPPISYRDARTDHHAAVLDRIGADRFFAITGLQALAIDTVFQLAAHDRAQLARARQLLMLPELLVHHLTGVVTGEHTSAGTTGLLDVHARAWSDEVVDCAGVAPSLLPPLQPAGTAVGAWRGIPVHLVGGHDTASAVLASGDADDPFVATGTWLIVGREQAKPDTSDVAYAAGLGNELGAFGGVRLLRNVAGWWLVEECRRQWADADLDELLEAAARIEADHTADALDPRLLAPTDMATTIAELAGLPDPADRAAITRCAVESMAASAARVVASLPPTGGPPAPRLRVFGGGIRSRLLLDAVARRTGLEVVRGPVEAAALGNAVAQAFALGVFADVDDARATLALHDEEDEEEVR
jgi:rhamnulokinase